MARPMREPPRRVPVPPSQGPGGANPGGRKAGAVHVAPVSLGPSRAWSGPGGGLARRGRALERGGRETEGAERGGPLRLIRWRSHRRALAPPTSHAVGASCADLVMRGSLSGNDHPGGVDLIGCLSHGVAEALELQVEHELAVAGWLAAEVAGNSFLHCLDKRLQVV